MHVGLGWTSCPEIIRDAVSIARYEHVAVVEIRVLILVASSLTLRVLAEGATECFLPARNRVIISYSNVV